jgi:hypothetical protein
VVVDGGGRVASDQRDSGGDQALRRGADSGQVVEAAAGGVLTEQAEQAIGESGWEGAL